MHKPIGVNGTKAVPDDLPFGTKRVSVVIITWNQREMTKSCLNSLLPTVDLEKDEIIVVDNGSVDGTDAMILECFPEVLYRRVPVNLGVGPARNRGIILSSGRFVMTLDNDTNIHPVDLGATIEKVFSDHPSIGLFGFRLLNRDGTLQASARRFPTILHPIIARAPGLHKWGFFRRLHSEHMMHDADFENVSEMLEVEYVLGANQVIRRKALGDVGLYDDSIFYGPEDFELCLRLHRAGWKVGWCPHATIEHDYARITRRFSRTTLRFIAAYYYVFRRYRAVWRLPKRK